MNGRLTFHDRSQGNHEFLLVLLPPHHRIPSRRLRRRAPRLKRLPLVRRRAKRLLIRNMRLPHDRRFRRLSTLRRRYLPQRLATPHLFRHNFRHQLPDQHPHIPRLGWFGPPEHGRSLRRAVYFQRDFLGCVYGYADFVGCGNAGG